MGRMKTGMTRSFGKYKKTKSKEVKKKIAKGYKQQRENNKMRHAVAGSGTRAGAEYIRTMIETELQSGPVKRYTKEEIAEINREMKEEENNGRHIRNDVRWNSM